MLKKIIIVSIAVLQLYSMERAIGLVKTQIYTIGSFQRGDQTIAVIGIDQDGEGGGGKALTREDELILTSFLEAQNELTVFCPGTKHLYQNIATSALANLKEGNNLLLVPFIALKAHRSLSGQGKKGIVYKFCPEQKDEVLQYQMSGMRGMFGLEQYKNLAICARIDTSCCTLSTLEEKLKTNSGFRKTFFGNKGQFINNYIAYIRDRSKVLKLNPLLTDLEVWLSELKIHPNIKDDTNLMDQLAKMTNYIETYKNPESTTLIDLISENMFAKKSVKEGIVEAQNCLFHPQNEMHIATGLHTVQQTWTSLDALTDKRVLLVIEEQHIDDLKRELSHLGFKNSFHSAVLPTNGLHEIRILPTQGIGKKEIQTFLSTVFNRSQPTINVTAQPIKFLNKNTLKEQPLPFLDTSWLTCKICKLGTRRDESFIHYKDTVVCSCDCFIKSNDNWLQTLLQTVDLNDTEQDLLKRAYFFAHYCALIISPLILRDSSEFYRSNHEQIAQYFDYCIKRPQEWQKIMDLYASLGIPAHTIHEFLIAFAQAKKLQRQNMLTFVRQRSSISLDNMNDWTFPQFDENLAIARRQKNIIDASKKALMVDHDVVDSAIIRYFRELEKSILRKLDNQVVDINSLFATELDAFISSLPTKVAAKKIQELETPLIQKIDSDESESFEEVEQDAPVISKPLAQRKQKTKVHLRNIKDRFGNMPYDITLFNTRPLLSKNDTLENARRLFKTCMSYVFDKRISTLFSIVDALEDVSVTKDRYNMPLIDCPELNLDEKVQERLNINHLFSRSVDHSIQSMGIAEQKDGHLLVSIPGEIMIDNTRYVGFFQYSFNAKDWRCFHRCFVLYNANINNEEYVSIILRQALYDYLVAHHSEKTEYELIIKELKRILP